MKKRITSLVFSGFVGTSLVLGCLGIAFSDPAPGSFADCVVDRIGNKQLLVCGDEPIDMGKKFDDALQRIKQKEADAKNTRGIYIRYLRKLNKSDQARVENLSELTSLLALEYPELYESFVDDIRVALKRLKDKVSKQSGALVSAYQRFNPSIGGRLDPPAVTDRFEDFLRDALADFVVSSEPPEITALETDPPPISSIPFIYGSLRTGALTGDTGNSIGASTDFDIAVNNHCVDASTCVHPSGWDFRSNMTLVWKSFTLSQQEVEDIVQQSGYKLTMKLNGRRITIGPPPGSGSTQDWYAVAMQPTTQTGLYDAPYCPSNRQCVATTISAGKVLKDEPLPWRFQFIIEKVVPLDPPRVIVDTQSGEATTYYLGLEPYSDIGYTVSANSTSGQSFFEEAIAGTFKSDRCMDCHGLSTADALAAHHGLQTQDFVDTTGLELEPSAYVAGAHVITCSNCHYVPATDNNGHEFTETEWKAPYVDLDVDWRVKSNAQICRRVLQNLPTHALRHQHFNEDARLFWAIELPIVFGERLEPQAYPQNFDTFLWRTFIWSLYIAGCP